MPKSLNSSIKEKTSTDIYDSIAELIIKDNPELLTITNIAKRSGYSIGNIYHHFKNIDDIIDKFVINRIELRASKIINFIDQAPPSVNASDFIKSLNDENFDLMNNKLPRTMFLLLARKFFDKPALKEKFNAINISQATAIEAMINRNETDTFKKQNYHEIELAVLMLANAVRTPIVLGHKLALSKSHQKISLDISLALFAK